jgi:hypothetical protein
VIRLQSLTDHDSISELHIYDPATGHAVAAMRTNGVLYKCLWPNPGSTLYAHGDHGIYAFDWIYQ